MSTSKPLGARKAAVLRAVVQDYIKSGEPVGSGPLARRHGLRVSPATIRNDMAVLDELGFLTQPHTSAGRVPTDLGYRFYVDTLEALPRLPEAQRRSIAASIDERVSDLEEMMRRTANVLSRNTRYAAVALSPAPEGARLVRAELVPLGASALLLAVTATGHVDKRPIDLPEGVGADEVVRASRRLEAALEGLAHADAAAAALALAEGAPAQEAALYRLVAEGLRDIDHDAAGEHAFLGGVGNIAGEDAFAHRGTLRRIYEALEEEATVLRVLRGLTEEPGPVVVRIGSENEEDALREASVVLARYEVGGELAGTIAVIGPTRMEYPSAMSTVAEVARRLSEAIDALGG